MPAPAELCDSAEVKRGAASLALSDANAGITARVNRVRQMSRASLSRTSSYRAMSSGSAKGATSVGRSGDLERPWAARGITQEG